MKRLQITSEMQALINAAAGTDVDPNTIAAFECVAVTNTPITKPHSIFDGATFDVNYFSEMSQYLLSGKSVFLASMHNTTELPMGRVFNAKAQPDHLRAQFYVPLSDKTTVENIDNGLIGYVSIGAMPKSMLCSECNFDYRGKDTLLNLLEKTCPNEHTVGENGVHIMLHGLDKWFELSLCGSGASPGAAILARSKATLAREDPNQLERLAASGTPPEALMLITSPTGEVTMDIKEVTTQFTAQLAESATKIATLTAKAESAETQLNAVQTQLTSANTALAAANTQLTAAQARVTELEPLVATVTEVTTFLKDQATAALVAAGEKTDSLPSDLPGIIANLKNSGKHLGQILASQSARGIKSTTEKTGSIVSNSAFKSRQ